MTAKDCNHAPTASSGGSVSGEPSAAVNTGTTGTVNNASPPNLRNAVVVSNSNVNISSVNTSAAVATGTATTDKEKLQEEKFRMQQLEASRRENVLVMRLTAKEQEVQEYLAQLEELRAGLCSSNKRNSLLDPAVNAIFQRMKLELQQAKEKLFQSQQEFDAWKFTPDSSTGKRLMAKCRMLIQENEELGKITSVGRIAKLEGDIAVVKKLCEELKSSQKDIEAFLLEMDENMEGMQSTVMSLQRKIDDLQEENRLLREQSAVSPTDQCKQRTSGGGELAPTAAAVGVTTTRNNDDDVDVEDDDDQDKKPPEERGYRTVVPVVKEENVEDDKVENQLTTVETNVVAETNVEKVENVEKIEDNDEKMMDEDVNDN